jgi:hypothetical protein
MRLRCSFSASVRVRPPAKALERKRQAPDSREAVLKVDHLLSFYLVFAVANFNKPLWFNELQKPRSYSKDKTKFAAANTKDF